MSNVLKQFSLLRSEKLSSNERVKMRAKLIKQMEAQSLGTAHPDKVFIFGGIIEKHKRTVGFTVAMVLAVLSGASYAAASSLPGDILYPVKINVNERVEAALAITPKATAEFAQKQITRRVVEAETLEHENRLDDAKKNQLAEETKKYVDTYAEARTKMENSGNRNDAEELEGNMRRTMSAHERTFHNIGVLAATSTSADDKEDVTLRMREWKGRRSEFIGHPSVSDGVNIESSSTPSLYIPTHKEDQTTLSHSDHADDNVFVRTKNWGDRTLMDNKGGTEADTSPTPERKERANINTEENQ